MCIRDSENTDEFFECAANPDLRYIISNTTEAGIEYKPDQNPDDFAGLTFPGRLTLFMKKRYDNKLPGFLLLPCELIDKNGDELKACVLKYAKDFGYGDDFVKWVEEENYFTNTLVDRIVTGYPRDTAAEMEKEYGYLDNIIDTAEISVSYTHLDVYKRQRQTLSPSREPRAAESIQQAEEAERFTT